MRAATTGEGAAPGAQPRVRQTVIWLAASDSSSSSGCSIPEAVRKLQCSMPSTPTATACSAAGNPWV